MNMKRVSCYVIIIIFVISFVSVQAGEPPSFSIDPPLKLSKKISIGYFEGGPWIDYSKIFKSMISRFMELGWLEKAEIPTNSDDQDSRVLWNWLAAEVKSNYLKFRKDAYYSDGWDKEKSKINRLELLNRLNTTGEIDIMIAMGTLAGKALATNEHSVPTVVCSATDPLQAGIIKSIDDSGYDHVTSRVDPTRYKRQVEAFHDMINFKRLGMAFVDTVVGKSYAGLNDALAVAKLRNFDIVECHTIDDIPDTKRCSDSVIRCARELAPKIDAFYMTIHNGYKEALHLVLEAMNQYRIPIFAQQDMDMVRQGVLMSVDDKSYIRTEGFFYSDNIARIINGAKPRDLNQLHEEPVTIIFNKEAAKIIDLDDNTYKLLSNIADEVYETIDPPSHNIHKE